MNMKESVSVTEWLALKVVSKYNLQKGSKQRTQKYRIEKYRIQRAMASVVCSNGTSAGISDPATELLSSPPLWSRLLHISNHYWSLLLPQLYRSSSSPLWYIYTSSFSMYYTTASSLNFWTPVILLMIHFSFGVPVCSNTLCVFLPCPLLDHHQSDAFPICSSLPMYTLCVIVFNT